MVRRYVFILFIFCLAGFGFAGERNEPGYWIAITPGGLEKAIEPLCEHRRREGFDVIVARTEDIYSSKDTLNAVEIQRYLQEKYKALRGQGPVYVLLVGAVRPAAKGDRNTLPTLTGGHGRMKGRPCDFGFSNAADTAAPTAALGRLPGRTPEEIEYMVEKILRYETSDRPGAWKNRLSLMAGNPGGQTLMQKNLAGMFVQMMGQQRLSRIHPFWCVDAIIHVPGSEFYVSDEQLPARAVALMEKGQVFSFYLGHSGPECLASDGIEFLNQNEWSAMRISNLQGVLFTCGCYAQYISESEDGNGYAFSAMRNPHGPAAVIGAAGESYGAIGQLAFDGMLECLGRPAPPDRLGEYWRSVQSGIAAGDIEPAVFTLYDFADGSRGQTTLEFQRIEHLEMWALLGDPAMRIPVPAAEVKLRKIQPVYPGQKLHVEGTVSKRFEGGHVCLTLEKTLRKPAAADDFGGGVWMGASGYCNEGYILDKAETEVINGEFAGRLKVPLLPSPAEVIVRAYVIGGDQDAMAVGTVDYRLPGSEDGPGTSPL